MNTFELGQCSKNDDRVRLMFDKMMFETITTDIGILVGNCRMFLNLPNILVLESNCSVFYACLLV